MYRISLLKPLKVLVIILAIMLTGIKTNGQNRDARNKIESARIALITERLGLTPDQAEKFWPVYREYTEKRRGMAQELRQARQGMDPKNMSDEQSKRLVNMAMEVKQSELDLEKQYSGRLMNVISSQQMLSLRRAEEDFRRMLLQRLQERRQQQERQQQFQQQRREEMMRNRQGNN